MKLPRGGFVLGLVIGLLVGLALALGVALYITKAPIPFVNKVQQRTPEQDSAEAERNRNWDPNAALAGKATARQASAASAPQAATVTTGATAGTPPSAAPATTAGAAPGPATPSATAARDAAATPSGPKPTPPPAPAPAPRSTAKAADPFVYFVQAGAFSRSLDAEQQRARLALMGHSAGISEREQGGRTMYRVRIGPMPTREQADALQLRLQDNGLEAQIVRVERP